MSEPLVPHAEPIFSAGRFEGFTDRDCGEHRTVSVHRAWCFQCAEWCYPEIPCIRCDPRRPRD